MHLTVVSRAERLAMLMAQLWEQQGHVVARLEPAAFAAARRATAFAGVEPGAVIWAAEPFTGAQVSTLRTLGPAVPLIDLSYVLAPAALPDDMTTLVPLQVRAPSGYVLCLTGRGADGSYGDGTSLVLASDWDEAKSLAIALVLGLGRRVRDIGPLEAVRYLDRITLDWFATL